MVLGFVSHFFICWWKLALTSIFNISKSRFYPTASYNTNTHMIEMKNQVYTYGYCISRRSINVIVTSSQSIFLCCLQRREKAQSNPKCLRIQSLSKSVWFYVCICVREWEIIWMHAIFNTNTDSIHSNIESYSYLLIKHFFFHMESIWLNCRNETEWNTYVCVNSIAQAIFRQQKHTTFLLLFISIGFRFSRLRHSIFPIES